MKKYFYKFIFFVFVLILCVCINGTAHAQGGYPLEDNEEIIEQVMDGDRVQLITCIDGQYYIKELMYEQDNWIIMGQMEVEPRKTGLEVNEWELEKDKSLEYSIENELKSQGFSYNSLPQILDYSASPNLPPVGAQKENSCVGWAAGYYLRTFQQAVDVGWNVGSQEEHIFSPSFIYNQINGGTDRGAYMEDAGKLIRNVGAATLSSFPYIPGDFLRQPTAEVVETAFPHRIRDWRIIYTQNDSDDYIIQKTKEYLNTGDLVIAGSNVGFKFHYPYKDNKGNSIITTEAYPSSGHAYVIVGYDDTLLTPEGYGAFKLVNSWGTEWGNEGFSYITYKAYAQGIVAGYVFTDLVNEEMEGSIQMVETEVLSPTEVKFTWDEPLNAVGYRILDSNYRAIKEIYGSNSYIEHLTGPGYIDRYVQAFDLTSSEIPVRAAVDTRNFKQKALRLTLNDFVIFSFELTGIGRYGIEIIDDKGNPTYIEDDIQGTEGQNNIVWNGTGLSGEKTPDGNYTLNIITYKNGMPNNYYPYTFQKRSKVREAAAIAYLVDNELQRVELSITAHSDCLMNIRIDNNNSSITVAEDDLLKAGENRVYTISKLQYDLSNIVIDASSIKIEAR